jgi:glycosyltransferase involved in cell wall biosynthesis
VIRRITVAICTRNRASSLARTLDAMTSLDVPPGLDWELLVVDNGSTDDTDRVIDSFRERLPLRGLHEPRPGLANARNCAVDSATGDYLVWTDDDATPDVAWLGAYSRAFERWPEAAVFGGRVDADFEGTPPSWLLRALWRIPGAYAIKDLEPEPKPLDPDLSLPFGVNFAIRLEEQRRHRYEPTLGRQPGHPGLSGEETDVISRALADGESGWWVPEARVVHHIPRERQTFAHLRRFYAAYGEIMSRAAVPGETRARLLGQACLAEVRYRAARVVQPPERWIVSLVASAVAWGRFRSSRQSPRQDHPAARSTAR